MKIRIEVVLTGDDLRTLQEMLGEKSAENIIEDSSKVFSALLKRAVNGDDRAKNLLSRFLDPHFIDEGKIHLSQ